MSSRVYSMSGLKMLVDQIWRNCKYVENLFGAARKLRSNYKDMQKEWEGIGRSQ